MESAVSAVSGVDPAVKEIVKECERRVEEAKKKNKDEVIEEIVKHYEQKLEEAARKNKNLEDQAARKRMNRGGGMGHECQPCRWQSCNRRWTITSAYLTPEVANLKDKIGEIIRKVEKNE